MRRGSATLLIALAVLMGAQACSRGPRPSGRGWTQRGQASWYGPGFDGRKTASGERYDMNAMTAAHKELPFGTRVEVRNLDNGQRTWVRINDRGPFVRGRIIDLSRAAAEAIAMIGPGTARVELRARLDRPAPGPASFTVQVGAFRARALALALAAELRRDYEVEVQASSGWHRVRVGGRRSKKAAQRLAAELRGRGEQAVVVPASE
ncbi:MAG: septal ring lytic transglycosylase RlpA family protein [Acidobacteria bacterium]|nr:septal ring lytic transglycosylase RlpA family protein [Acidobacteriota bacterium]